MEPRLRSHELGLGRVGGRMDDEMARRGEVMVLRGRVSCTARRGEVTVLRGRASCAAIHCLWSFLTPVALRVGSHGLPEDPTLHPPKPPLAEQP